MGRTLKYVYVPVVKNAFEYNGEKFDVIIQDLDFIPFYQEQEFGEDNRYKIAKILNMYNLAELINLIPNENIYPDLFYEEVIKSANTSNRDYVYSNYEDTDEFKEFIKWYNRQKIDFVVLDVEDQEKVITYFRYNQNVSFKDIFKDLFNGYGYTDVFKPWLVLKPNRGYPYLNNDSLDFISLNFESYGSYYFDVKSRYLIAYLLEEHKIPYSILTLDFDYVPIEFEVEFEVDNKKASFYWKPHDGCDYCINVKYLFTDLVSSEEEIEVDPNFLYDQIIEDHIRELENKYHFKAIVCGRSGGYFGFSRNDFRITDQIKVKVSTSMLVNTLLEEEKYSIDDFNYEVNKVIEDTIEDAIYYKEDLEDYVDIVEYVYNTKFIEFNKDLYRIIKALSSGPELRSWEEYDFWCKSGFDNEKLNEYRKEQKKEV